MSDDTRWWLSLPPCPKCDRPHVLTDCVRENGDA